MLLCVEQQQNISGRGQNYVNSKITKALMLTSAIRKEKKKDSFVAKDSDLAQKIA